ncbi:unnamed protein product [Schistosoma margrebowiei]|uniref:Uncharacterized protein n=1 Tax=Schistosoma margrebowiei TaxID=48269 RepID=A0A183ME19_9TREM|nr:unnamed protein product [Schistosoma margrebowiei]
MQLDDLDFADDLALVSSTPTNADEDNWCSSSLCISRPQRTQRKCQTLKYNAESNHPNTLDGGTADDVISFKYLGSIIDEHGGSEADVWAKTRKATAAFLQLKNI